MTTSAHAGPPVCPQCGRALPADAPAGNCPACLAGLGLLSGDSQIANPRIRYFGDYELQEEIARGGMGVVYKARQVSLNRTLAVKMILAGQLASVADVQRFRQEAEAAASLQHPNIVAIHEVGEHEGQHYFSMDFVEGRDMTALVRETPLPSARAAAYVKTIGEAVHYAHKKGIIHRDLKPSNVLIDDADQPRITDFGLAKRFSNLEPGNRTGNPKPETRNAELTLTGQVLGSPSYMSPEQARGRSRDVGPCSDIYSLGAILYHLLTGRPPFAAETMVDTLQQVVSNEPPAPRLLNPGVPRDLETITLKCLEKDPARRYTSAQALADELGRFLRDEPICARPVRRTERIYRWCRRKPALAGALAIAAVALMTGTVAVTWQWRRADTAHRETRSLNARLDDTMQQVAIAKAEELFEGNDAASAVAYLASALRQEPTHRMLAERLVWSLSQRTFLMLPVVSPGATNVSWPPDGTTYPSPGWRRAVTVSRPSSPEAQLWNLEAATAKPATLTHHDRILWISFSADSRRLASASADNTARVWDADTGRPVLPPIEHTNAIRWAVLSPDAAVLLTIEERGPLRLWDATNGMLLAQLRQPRSLLLGVNTTVTFSRDGRRLATLSAEDERVVCLWDTRTGQQVVGPMSNSTVVATMEFSADGELLATATADRTLRVWETKNGTLVSGPISFGGAGAGGAAGGGGQFLIHPLIKLSPDGLRVATISDGRRPVQLWNLRTGESVAERLPFDSVPTLEFTADGLRLVTVWWEPSLGQSSVQVWDAGTGQALSERWRAKVPLSGISSSPEGASCIVRGLPSRLWSLLPAHMMGRPLDRQSPMPRPRFGPNGNRVVTPGGDGLARMWDAASGQPVGEPRGLLYPLFEFTQDGQAVVSAVAEGGLSLKVQLWEAASGRALGPALEFEKTYRLCVSANGEHILAISGGTGQVWAARSGQRLREIPLGTNAITSRIEFSPDGQQLLTTETSASGQVTLWSAQTGQALLEPQYEGESLAGRARFSPDGRQIVVYGNLDRAGLGRFFIWDVPTRQMTRGPLRHNGRIVAAEFDSEGRRIVTCGDGTVRIWDLVTGQALAEIHHRAAVKSVRFSSDGTRLAAVLTDDTGRLWDARTGHALCEPIRGVMDISPDGQRLLTLEADELVRVWDMPKLPAQIPLWLPDLAEAMAGKRVTSGGLLEDVSEAEQWKFKEQLERDKASDLYTRWARWLLGDRATRPIAPFSTMSTPEYVQDLLHQGTLLSLHEAVRLAPTNASAFARLARRIQSDSLIQKNPHATASAAWYKQRARQLGGRAHDAGARAQPIDLSAFFNMELTETWIPANLDNSLGSVPRGTVTMADTSFDVRSLIQLAGDRFVDKKFPEQVNGIPVRRACQRLHFLMGNRRWVRPRAGSRVGSFVIHHADGSTTEAPILYDQHVRDWWVKPGEPPASGDLTVAWAGTNAEATSHRTTIRLFKLTWENPRTDHFVTSVDFVSSMTSGNPFLVALTAE